MNALRAWLDRNTSTLIGTIIAVILLAGLLHVVNVCVSRGTHDAQYYRGNQNNHPLERAP